MHPRQIVLGVRIAERRRGELEHLQRALRIGTDLAVGYSVQIVVAKRDQRARHNRAIAPVGVVFIVICDDLREIVIRLDIVARCAVAIGINFGEFPLREQLPPAAASSQASIAEVALPERTPSRPACNAARGVANVWSGAFSTAAPSVASNAPMREPGKQAASPKSKTPEMRLNVSIGICFTRRARMRNGSGNGRNDY